MRNQPRHMTPPDDSADRDAMARAREKMRAKGFSSAPRARRARERQINGTVDGRSLRATGRTEQFNFKAKPGIKLAAMEAAKAEGLTMAEWMENLLQSALGLQGE